MKNNELTPRQITVKLDDIAHLFVAPEFDPFSDQEAELVGQPALIYVLRQLAPGTVRKQQPLRLVVQLPPDKITSQSKARADQALARYCAKRAVPLESIGTTQRTFFPVRYGAVCFLPIQPARYGENARVITGNNRQVAEIKSMKIRKSVIITIIFLSVFCIKNVSGYTGLDKLFDRANDLYKEKRYDEAVSSYKKIISEGFENGSLFFNLGNCYFKLGKKGEAVFYYTKAALFIPRDSDLKANYGYVLSLLGAESFESYGNWFERLVNRLFSFLSLDSPTCCARWSRLATPRRKRPQRCASCRRTAASPTASGWR